MPLRDASIPALLFVALLTPTLTAQVPSKPGEWPQWRGPNRDGVANEKGLLKEWPKDGPAIAWQVDNVGVGYSSLAVKDGRIITQGDLAGVEHVIAVSLKDGSLLWAVQPEPVLQLLASSVEEAWEKLDRNGDGKVDELEALLGDGWKFNNYNRKEAAADAAKVAALRAFRLLAALDQDKNGKLEFAETKQPFRDGRDRFSAIDQVDKTANAAELAEFRTEAELKKYDADTDGKLTRKETSDSTLGKNFNRADRRDEETKQRDGELTKAEILEYFLKQQEGKDGHVTEKELAEYLMKQYPGADGKLTRDELKMSLGGFRNSMGDGPRGTPTIDGDHVYVEGGNGDVSCLATDTGRTIWHVNLSKDFGGRRPGWGYSESPLVEGDLVIVTPGGQDGAMVALNKKTGDVAWRTGGVGEPAHYASAVAADIGGVRQIVQFARQNVFGVSAKDGSFLWKYSGANNGTANCSTPIVYKDHVFASSAYSTGGGLARITNKDGDFSAREVYFEKRMANHHGGLVRVGDYLYGFGNGGLICMHMLTGKIAWHKRSVSKGSLLVADGMLYLLGESHQIALAEVSPEEYREKGRFRIKNLGRPSWAHPVIADGKLLIRNLGSLTAYELRGQ